MMSFANDRTKNQIDHILIDKRRHVSIKNVRTSIGGNCLPTILSKFNNNWQLGMRENNIDHFSSLYCTL